MSLNRNLPQINKIFRNTEKTSQFNKNDYTFFSNRIYFTSNDGSRKTFVYQPTLITLLKKDKSIDYVLSWKVYESKVKSIYTALMYSMYIIFPNIVWE